MPFPRLNLIIATALVALSGSASARGGESPGPTAVALYVSPYGSIPTSLSLGLAVHPWLPLELDVLWFDPAPDLWVPNWGSGGLLYQGVAMAGWSFDLGPARTTSAGLLLTLTPQAGALVAPPSETSLNSQPRWLGGAIAGASFDGLWMFNRWFGVGVRWSLWMQFLPLVSSVVPISQLAICFAL